MSTEHIQKFLQTAYSDEKLAGLLAHAQDGKLSYWSCCCLIGLPSADHAIQGPILGDFQELKPADINTSHYNNAHLTTVVDAEREFRSLGGDVADEAKADELRRERLIPLILAEMQRREAEKLPEPTAEMGHVGEDGGWIPDWRDEEPYHTDTLTAMEREKGLKK